MYRKLRTSRCQACTDHLHGALFARPKTNKDFLGILISDEDSLPCAQREWRLEGACRRPARGSAVAARQAEAAHHRRARLSAIRAERGALVLPARQPALRAGQRDDPVQSPSWRVGHRVWRPGGGDRHPRSSSAPQPCDHHPRRQLPAEREAPRGPRAEAAGRRDGRGQSMTQVDQFFMSPPDQFLMSFDTLYATRRSRLGGWRYAPEWDRSEERRVGK